MFTGIIEAMGVVASIEQREGDVHLQVNSDELDFSDVNMGDSIATDGVCLTVVELVQKEGKVLGYCADVSVETLDLTTLNYWQLGQTVNLEKALTPQTRLGGHLVSGHVDGLGEVLSQHRDARAYRFTLKAPNELAKYIAHKGSITVDGTSLTVNAVNGSEFELAIVPHTWDNTVISRYIVGTKVNLEVDLIARHLERLLLGDKAAEKVERKK
ncbi:MAG: riboflavin synthase [Cellvibrionaceae bacterium]